MRTLKEVFNKVDNFRNRASSSVWITYADNFVLMCDVRDTVTCRISEYGLVPQIKMPR